MMRKLVLALVIAWIGILPLVSAHAQNEPVAQTEAKTTGPFYPVIIGLGAIAGVVFYNVASYGTSGVPLLAPVATTGAMVTANAIAQNRLYTIVSAVAGALITNWLYGN